MVNRRVFIERGLKYTIASGLLFSGLPGCHGTEALKEKEVSPPEDLMQEHGVLNRVLLIYDCCRDNLLHDHFVNHEILQSGANIIRNFIENYHEKQEEDYLFPRFERANQLTDLVQTLRKQHTAGRLITDHILQLTKAKQLTAPENQRLIALLGNFNTMYRPHEAREDTVLFPAFRQLVSKNEYDSLGEEFENNERNLFGEDGFKSAVEKVAGLEKALGIYELDKFTPM